MSKTIARMLSGVVKAATFWQRPMRRSNTLLRVSNALHQYHAVETRAGPISFLSTHPQALDYPSTLLTREPDTIAWLDQLNPGDVLWDIGANVGGYALYGARRGATVWAFEPAPASFAALSENVRINHAGERIWAVSVALGGSTGIARLAMQSTNPGSVSHSLGDSHVGYNQAAISFTVDEFRSFFALAQPTHIKLDVDGIEPDILVGAVKTMSDPAFRSLLVETDEADTDRNHRITAATAAAGLFLKTRGEPDGCGTCNVIFERAERRDDPAAQCS